MKKIIIIIFALIPFLGKSHEINLDLQGDLLLYDSYVIEDDSVVVTNPLLLDMATNISFTVDSFNLFLSFKDDSDHYELHENIISDRWELKYQDTLDVMIAPFESSSVKNTDSLYTLTLYQDSEVFMNFHVKEEKGKLVLKGVWGVVYSLRKKGIDDKINEWFTPIADGWGKIVLYPFHFKPPTDSTSFSKIGFGWNRYKKLQNQEGELLKVKDEDPEIIYIPIVLLLLVFGALFFTIKFSFINIRKFPLAINTVRGKYDSIEKNDIKSEAISSKKTDVPNTIKDESQDGEVSHFQALTTAVSGTVGLGNIAGVALAIAIGGPGATFWMIICGLLGMSTKFVECTLGVKYRDVGDDGTVYGGPMYYLTKGLNEEGFKRLGKFLAALFAVLCVGASFGGGNAAQSNQAALQISDMLGLTEYANSGTYIGIVLAIIVGVVIIGGIKRIATVTERVVPFMAGIYILACLFIIFSNFSYIDDAFALIFSKAFNFQAGFGAIVGVMIVGFQRAAFSNEAGAGSASIAHSAVKTKYPASEGTVALLEPFIDTVVICTMTALVIILFNFGPQRDVDGSVLLDNNGNQIITEELYFNYQDDLVIKEVKDENGKVQFSEEVGSSPEGAVLTSLAFQDAIPWFPIVLTIAIILFAISTMISWAYYGLQSWMYLFGKNKLSDLVYKSLFLIFIVIGAAANMSSVWGFSDAMILALIFPNMIGLFFLFPKVKDELAKYLKVTNKIDKKDD